MRMTIKAIFLRFCFVPCVASQLLKGNQAVQCPVGLLDYIQRWFFWIHTLELVLSKHAYTEENSGRKKSREERLAQKG